MSQGGYWGSDVKWRVKVQSWSGDGCLVTTVRNHLEPLRTPYTELQKKRNECLFVCFLRRGACKGLTEQLGSSGICSSASVINPGGTDPQFYRLSWRWCWLMAPAFILQFGAAVWVFLIPSLNILIIDALQWQHSKPAVATLLAARGHIERRIVSGHT